MNNQISDLLVRIRNAAAVQKYEVAMPFSKMREVILKTLRKEGFIDEIKVVQKKNQKFIKTKISVEKTPCHLRQISKPGQRIYVKYKEIPRPLRGFGLVVVSTSRGVLSGREASKQGLGGELICEVW